MSSDYLFLIFGIIHVALGQTIDEKPEDKTSCVGRDVEIPWHFKDETNLNIATWSVTSSALTGNILRKIGSASATILNSYNVVHNSNGKITLTSLTTDNSGTFKLSVTYNSATTAEEDTVELTVSETPTATLRCEDGSCQFDGGTTLGLVLSTEVNETRKYCCVTGAAAACIDGSTGTKYCIEVCKCSCRVLKIVWSIVLMTVSAASGAWTLYVIYYAGRSREWLERRLFTLAPLFMIFWIGASLLYIIIAVIIYNVLVCGSDCCESKHDYVCNCWPAYIIIGIVVTVGDLIVIIIGVIAFQQRT